MQTDAEIFADWLKGTTTVTTTRKRSNRKPKVTVTLNSELAKPIGIVGGLTPGGKGNSKRTGYIGARTSAPELTSDCIVTTANGDRYTLKRRRNHRTELTPAERLALVDLQNKIDKRIGTTTGHKVSAGDLPAIGNIE